MVCGLLDTVIPCFGEDVCYRPQAGGAFTIKAVFDDDHIFSDPDTEELISTNNPRIGVKLLDLAFHPLQGDRVDIGRESFDVTDVQEDGQGGAEIHLIKC